MKYRCLIAVLALILMCVPGQTAAEMSSSNYRITTTVMSGGGSPMGSASFQMKSTLGQSSPLMEQGMDPYSDNYGLLPGFWYTIGASVDICECNLNTDTSCNILDYQIFIQEWGQDTCGTPPGSGNPPNDCECDLNTDGRCNILDYQIFIQDWGRDDCL